MRRSWLLWTSAVLLLAACSTSSGSSDTSTTRRSSTTAKVTSTTTVTTSSAGSATSTTTKSAAPVTAFRPVVGSQLCSSVPAQGPDDETTTTPGTPELAPDQASKECYGVGPVSADQNDLKSAEATEVEGAWTVQLTPNPAARDKLNAFFNTCFAGQPSCSALSPDASGAGNGTVAIVRDDTVLFTWKIETQDLADASFQLPGPFSEADAKALASALNPGSSTSIPELPTDPADLQFRPVLSVTTCEHDPASDQPTTKETTLPSSDGASCYRVGPVAADGTALASARSGESAQGSWEVQVSASPDVTSRLNVLFNACFAAKASCPDGGSGHGAVAFVLSSKVISTPTVNVRNLASNDFQISGDFTQTEAEALARVLAG